MKKLMYLSVACAAFLLASCGGSSNQSNETNGDSGTEVTTPDQSSTTPGADVQVSNTINLTGNDQMQYDDTAFTVKAGETITLSLKNIGQVPAAAMSHDVVVLKPGSDYAEFGKAATVARELDKLSADEKAKMVAHTKMLGPGEEDTITFTLSEPGKYPFVCTFPGHYATMHGTITVVE